MPLTPISSLMRAAHSGGYAVGYFESWNLESLQGVIDAAEATKSPVIIGFNGEFLSNPKRLIAEQLDWYSALGRAAANIIRVPFGYIFNECPDDEWVRRAVTAGFNLVMPVPATGESHKAYTARTATIVRYAHAHGVAVEAELGTLPYGDDHPGETTDPEQAAVFAGDTNIDLLAISAGNVHVLLDGKRRLDIDRIAALRKRMDIPFVLHGGTGIDDDSLRAAIKLGVTKVNYGTVLKQAYLGAIRRALSTSEPNPHHLLGMGEQDDIMLAGRQAVRDAVIARIEVLGCAGKAVTYA
ncbi:MAG: class II fructose-bisphosphate aldolase [Chloroflexota bacterium]|nr:class II fructose-bisphosphate aldolase [Chloroflexota bacterium]